MMEHAAADSDDRPDGALSSSVGLVCVWYRGLLLDAFIFVENLKRVGRKFTGPVVSHKLDLLAELRLYHRDVLLDAVFTLRLGM